MQPESKGIISQMQENKQEYKQGEFTSKMIEDVFKDLFYHKDKLEKNKRRINLQVICPDEEASKKWMKEFNDLIIKELNNDYGV